MTNKSFLRIVLVAPLMLLTIADLNRKSFRSTPISNFTLINNKTY